MLFTLLIIGAVISVIRIFRSLFEDNLEALYMFISGVLSTVFFILGAVFGGSWTIAVAIIFGIASNAFACGNPENSKKHPFWYIVSFVMMVLFIIAVLNNI